MQIRPIDGGEAMDDDDRIRLCVRLWATTTTTTTPAQPKLRSPSSVEYDLATRFLAVSNDRKSYFLNTQRFFMSAQSGSNLRWQSIG